MATFKRFEDIDAWQDARRLTTSIYSVSGAGAFAKDFPLYQIRMHRVSLGVMPDLIRHLSSCLFCQTGRSRFGDRDDKVQVYNRTWYHSC